MRLKHARMLLLQSTDSILGVALKCGFSSASHLGRCFRETYGETPARVRKQAEHLLTERTSGSAL
jgi:transcriptional regulator GlxA family with amidase domain